VPVPLQAEIASDKTAIEQAPKGERLFTRKSWMDIEFSQKHPAG
jgi:hypothetical protein